MLRCSGLYETVSRISWMRRSSPTSTHSIEVASDARATPFTTSAGAKSPPMASTAITGIAFPSAPSCATDYKRPRRSCRTAGEPSPQRADIDAVLERLAAVDQQHGDLVTVCRDERRVRIDVD